MKSYHRVNRGLGPGGIRCSCCNRFHSGRSQKTTKQAINRLVRRLSKVEVGRMTENSEPA